MKLFKSAVPEQPGPLPPLDTLRYAADCHCFEPDSWNRGLINSLSNCYSYIIDSPVQRVASWFPQPGQFGLPFWRYLLSLFIISKQTMTEAAIADGLIPHDPAKPVPPGYYLTALVLRPGFLGDYHWYRLDYDRLRGGFVWTHKHGQKVPSDRDEKGTVIRDLAAAALMKKYPQWGGYFLVPREGRIFYKQAKPAVLAGAI